MAKKPPTAKQPCESLTRYSVADTERTRSLAPATNYYLLLYNALSCLGWGYILVVTYFHLTDVPLPEILSSTSKDVSAFSFQVFVEYIRELVEELIKEAKGLITPYSNPLVATIIPHQLLDIYNRMTTTYDVVGSAVAIVQTAAALEVVHSISGLVKSPLPTAVIQVYSRLFLVWGVTGKYEQVRWQFIPPTAYVSRVLFLVTSQCALLDHDPRLVHDRSDPLCLLHTLTSSKCCSWSFGLPAIHYILPSLSAWRLQ